MQTLRLRQAVVAAADLDAAVIRLTDELGLGAPFHDPGVELFGLRNAVLPIGDTFLEVVSPLVNGDGCSAERLMARRGGDCGYMVILQVANIGTARAHLRELGLRTVFELDLPEICCTHVHPTDIGAAIVSFDEAVPPESWHWAGPEWSDGSRTDVTTGLAGVHLASSDPDKLLRRWAAALNVRPDGDLLRLADGTSITVGATADDGHTGLVGIDTWAADGTAERSFDVAGVTFRRCARPGVPPVSQEPDWS